MAGIYIHVPFCKSKCCYCDFYSMPSRGRDDLMEKYFQGVLNEFKHRSSLLSGLNVNTLYIGGGTPSSLLLPLLANLIDALLVPEMKEVTVEINPEDITPALVELLASKGVNRVSMGIQSFNSDLLKFVGRRHSSDDIFNAVKLLRSAGISNISGDLIFGLPGDTFDGWKRSVETFMKLGLPHLSAYLLSYEPGTRLTVMRDLGKIVEATEDLVTRMYLHLIETSARHGYEHYEISNYAIPGYKSKHNSSYWDGTIYLGLGPGAHSFDGTTRSFNPPSLKEYIANNGLVNVIEETSLTDKINDLIITTLRTSSGLNLNTLSAYQRDQILLRGKSHLNRGTLNISVDNRLYIPEEHFLISDSILVDLIFD
ncbi:MAG: radical SAM family heme chaperone HemW [Muribaculaceae bacterium]|nr:radical SAM family heme chaperone HemW [Muribaculaceae bacterium]